MTCNESTTPAASEIGLRQFRACISGDRAINVLVSASEDRARPDELPSIRTCTEPPSNEEVARALLQLAALLMEAPGANLP